MRWIRGSFQPPHARLATSTPAAAAFSRVASSACGSMSRPSAWRAPSLTAAIATFVATWLWKERRRQDSVGLALILGGASLYAVYLGLLPLLAGTPWVWALVLPAGVGGGPPPVGGDDAVEVGRHADGTDPMRTGTPPTVPSAGGSTGGVATVGPRNAVPFCTRSL